MNINRKTEYNKGFHWLYLWSICYIIIVYAFLILLCEMKEGIFKYAAIPLIIGLINFIIVINEIIIVRKIFKGWNHFHPFVL